MTQADRIREVIVERLRERDDRRSNVLNLTAEALAMLHGRINGWPTELADLHSARHLRDPFRCERPLTLEDIALFTLDAPGATAALLEVLARTAVYRVAPDGQEVSSLAEAGARQISKRPM